MLKKALLFSAATAGALTITSVASRPAQAQRYVSGSATVTNFTGAISSVGAEVGGVPANGVLVTPTYNNGTANVFGVGFRTAIQNLNVVATVNTAVALTISEVVAQNLSAIAGAGGANLINATVGDATLAAYVSIVRAAGGNDGLE